MHRSDSICTKIYRRECHSDHLRGCVTDELVASLVRADVTGRVGAWPDPRWLADVKLAAAKARAKARRHHSRYAHLLHL